MLGIGGIGMSALARYFNSLGKKVYGYDKTPSPLTEQLINENIIVNYNDEINEIKNAVGHISNKNELLVIYTPAVPKNSKQYNYFIENNYHLFKRAEILGKITEGYYTIAVAGTHGKTTTSTIITHIVNQAGIKCNAFLGGISINYNTNVILNNQAQMIIVEADEYDKSFLKLYPDLCIVTSLDADHLDIYGSIETMKKTYHEFVSQIKNNGKLITKKSNNFNFKSILYYGDNNADYYAYDIRINNGKYIYNIHYPNGHIKDIVLGLPGIHNIENSLAACAIAHQLNISDEIIKSALESFNGVKRRFEKILENNNIIYIDDYAHHPAEIEACINSLKNLYPAKKLTVIFQPHLYTRTRDFMKEFAHSLSLADEIILLDIYPARELPIEGINSEELLKMIPHNRKKIYDKNELIEKIDPAEIEVLLTMGAGDIDRLVEPLKTKLLNRVNA
jgi:UDP-N-acetylmuramate--alanine ligase